MTHDVSYKAGDGGGGGGWGVGGGPLNGEGAEKFKGEHDVGG